MTKPRSPRSIDAALTRIAGTLPGGWTDMAEATDRRESLVRAWGDPARREQIPVRDAIILDRAFREAGGLGAPIFEYYAARLDLNGAFVDCEQIALARHAASVVRECGEASAAIVDAALPAASPAQRARATREIEEAIETLRRTRPLLSGPGAFDHLTRDSAAQGP